MGGITVNVRLTDVSFQDAERIGELLRELAGKGGEVFERSYEGKRLELDIVSERTARAVASFLSENGVEVEGLTAQTIEGRIAARRADAPTQEAPGATVTVRIVGVSSFKDASALEDALIELAGASSVSATFGDETFQAGVTGLRARDIATFLSERGIEIEGVSEAVVSGRASGDKKKGLW